MLSTQILLSQLPTADTEICNSEMNTNKYLVFLISNCRRVLDDVLFLLVDSTGV